MSRKQESGPANQKEYLLEKQPDREAQPIDAEQPPRPLSPAIGIGDSAVEIAARLAETARLLDLTNDAIIVRDSNNRITYWNRGATETYGWTTAEALGKDLHSLLQTEFEIPLEELLVKLREHD